MISELLDYVESPDFESGNVFLRESSLEGEDLKLTLELDSYTGDPIQQWQILCRSVVENQIFLGSTGSTPELLHDHVLQWPHVPNQATLTFHGSSQEPLNLIGSLYQKHVEIAGEWFSFHRFLNSSFVGRLPELLRGGFGTFAVGPEPLLRGYKLILDEHGFSTSMILQSPRMWNGETWVEEAVELTTFIIGKSYVVTSCVEAEKL